MILRNSKDQERNFKILFKVEHNDKSYYIYEDYITSRYYVGLKDGNLLKKVNEEEINFIKEILEKVNE